MHYAIQTLSKELHDLEEISYLDLIRPNFERQGLDVDKAKIQKRWWVFMQGESGEVFEIDAEEENATHVTVSFYWSELDH
jgi:hypothetical protein